MPRAKQFSAPQKRMQHTQCEMMLMRCHFFFDLILRSSIDHAHSIKRLHGIYFVARQECVRT